MVVHLVCWLCRPFNFSPILHPAGLHASTVEWEWAATFYVRTSRRLYWRIYVDRERRLLPFPREFPRYITRIAVLRVGVLVR
jgi:hypothetical protein